MIRLKDVHCNDAQRPKAMDKCTFSSNICYCHWKCLSAFKLYRTYIFIFENIKSTNTNSLEVVKEYITKRWLHHLIMTCWEHINNIIKYKNQQPSAIPVGSAPHQFNKDWAQCSIYTHPHIPVPDLGTDQELGNRNNVK